MTKPTPQESFFKTIKIFSFVLLLYSVVPLLVLYGIWLNPSLFKNAPLDEDVITQVFVFIYCVIGGIGLIKLKRWAFYFVVLPGVVNLFFVCMGFVTFIIALQYGGGYLPNYYTLFSRIFLGGISVYLFRNRSLHMNKN